jgi:hypothetical protein
MKWNDERRRLLRVALGIISDRLDRDDIEPADWRGLGLDPDAQHGAERASWRAVKDAAEGIVFNLLDDLAVESPGITFA